MRTGTDGQSASDPAVERSETSPPKASPAAKAHYKGLPAADLIAAGEALRAQDSRRSHGRWERDSGNVDPLAILRASDAGRLERLIPIRYGRMLQSPFTFYRGAASVMAADLARTPATGIRVQACGDCHLMNFGGFATPERNILFDINDFDETLPAPWEWDIKRLVASFVLAARNNGFTESDAEDAAVAAARSYRKRLWDYSQLSPLEIWYARITAEDVMDMLPNEEHKARLKGRLAKAREQSSSEQAYPKLADMVGGQVRIRDEQPLIFHPDNMSGDEFHDLLVENLARYRETLSDDRRSLLDHYNLVDGAIKVVGIGSVGTACIVTLLMSVSNEPLFLQWKEARLSVLEPYAGASNYAHSGQRVVMGQRLMQPATDVFLGWVTGKFGRASYVRQLRDMKIKPLVEAMDAETLTVYAKLCGWALARAHAKSGDPFSICGYLGSNTKFDDAMGRFAITYADQTERDHAALKAAVRAGKIEVHIED